MRSSSAVARRGPRRSASTTIVRNLTTRNCSPSLPMRGLAVEHRAAGANQDVERQQARAPGALSGAVRTSRTRSNSRLRRALYDGKLCTSSGTNGIPAISRTACRPSSVSRALTRWRKPTPSASSVVIGSGKAAPRLNDVEQQHVGAVARVEHRGELGGVGDVADDLDLALGRRRCAGVASSASANEPTSTTRGGPWRRRARITADVAVGDEHDSADEQEHGEVEAGHQVAVEEHERDELDADADRHRHDGRGQPRAPAEARLALVQAVEVVDDEVDRRRRDGTRRGRTTPSTSASRSRSGRG